MASLSRALRSCNALLSRDSAAPAGCEDTRTARYSEVGGGRVRVEVGDGIAAGEAALDGDWLGLHGLVVADEHRRAGVGTTVLAALLEWGAERGATTAWLHVEVDNAPGAGALRAGRLPHAPRLPLPAPGTVTHVSRRGTGPRPSMGGYVVPLALSGSGEPA